MQTDSLRPPFSSTSKSSSPKPTKILLVEDEYDLLDILTLAFEECGYAVEAFWNPYSALQRFTNSPEEFDVVLTDIKMPKMNGVELAQQIILVKPTAQVLFMTALDIDDAIKIKIQNLSNFEILRKPFSIKELWPQIKLAALGKKIGLSFK